MFIDNSISNKIRNCTSIDQLIQFLKENKNMILSFKSDIMTTINKINKNSIDVKIDMSYLDFFFFNKKKVSNVEFEFLNFYCNNILPCLSANSNLNESAQALFLLMLDKDKLILNEDILYQVFGEKPNPFKILEQNLYSKILDLNVPCDNPGEIINQIMLIDKSLITILKIPYDKETFKKLIYEAQQYVFLEAIYLFKWISDIYSNNDVKYNTFEKLHYMETLSLPLRDKIDVIEKRYSRYFKDETMEMIYRVLMIFNQDYVDITLSEFVLLIKKEFQINIKILEAFLRDILEISYDYTDAYRYDRSVEVLALLCREGLDKINPPENKTTTESFLTQSDDELDYAVEAYKKDSKLIHNTQTQIYKAYKNYKKSEDKIDSQISKAVQGMKGVLIGDVKTEVIEGKKFSAIKLLKQLLGTAALFSFGPIQAVITLTVRYALKKSTTIAEKKKIILELEAELEMINEKIDDARGEGNRQAKYSMMRTRTELTTALKRIKYGLSADERSTNTAKSTITGIRSKL